VDSLFFFSGTALAISLWIKRRAIALSDRAFY
jgi:hypothetical protein